jgi:galactokinase
MAAGLPWPLRGRAEHVISDDARVRLAMAALADGDLPRVGELLDESHASLRDGGGFGGHVLGLMPPETQPPPGAMRVVPGPGAHLVEA